MPKMSTIEKSAMSIIGFFKNDNGETSVSLLAPILSCHMAKTYIRFALGKRISVPEA